MTLGVDTRQLSPAFDRTELSLGWVTHGPETRDTLLVVGDTAADFALAMGWDRVYGTGVWLPGERASSLDADDAPVRRILDDLVTRAARHAGRLRVTSTSLDAGALGRVVDRLRVPLPFQRMPDGTVTLLAPPPAPLLRQTQLQATPGLGWEVDLRIPEGVMPPGRGLPGGALLAPDEDRYLTWMRASRGQISFQAQRYDLFLRGTAPASQLARPGVRSLGLLEWARTIAAEASLAVDFSQAGNRVEILRQLLGSGDSLADLMAGPMRAALRAFHATHRSTSVSYPEGNGVVVAGDGYLSLANLHSIGTALLIEELRHQMDALTACRVVRRGHLLSYATCDRWTFYDVDRFGQTNTCPRCNSVNELARPRWKGSESEPTWYYDLHPVARDVLAQNGDVPLLLAHHLRSRASRYADLAEIEILDDQEAVAECDLLAMVDDVVVIAQAKVTSKLAGTKAETRRAIAKRVQLAQVLRADQIVLATSSAEWQTADLDQLKDAIGRASWPIRRPVLRVVSGLGSGQVTDSGSDGYAPGRPAGPRIQDRPVARLRRVRGERPEDPQRGGPLIDQHRQRHLERLGQPDEQDQRRPRLPGFQVPQDERLDAGAAVHAGDGQPAGTADHMHPPA